MLHLRLLDDVERMAHTAATTLKDIYTFAKARFTHNNLILVHAGRVIPEASLERWSAYTQRIGEDGTAIFAIIRDHIVAPAPVPDVKVGYTVLALDGATISERGAIKLSLGNNSGAGIYAAFRVILDLYDVFTVGLRSPDATGVMHVLDRYTSYGVDELSHLFVIVHPKRRHAGGRSRDKNTSERSLSRSYRH